MKRFIRRGNYYLYAHHGRFILGKERIAYSHRKGIVQYLWPEWKYDCGPRIKLKLHKLPSWTI